MSAVDESLAQVEFSSSDKIIGEGLQHVLQNAFFHPALEATKTGRVRRISIGHVSPWRAGSQDPEHAVEHVARIAPRSAATILANLRLRKKLLDCGPLLVGQVHLDLRSQTGSSVDRLRIRFNFRDLTEPHL